MLMWDGAGGRRAGEETAGWEKEIEKGRKGETNTGEMRQGHRLCEIQSI